MAYGRPVRSSAVPVVVTVQPTTVRAGSDVSITVTLDQTVSVDQQVKVSTDSSMFTNWTTYVTVAAGQSTVTFTRTLTTTAEGSFSVSASCNGAAAASLAVVVGMTR